MGRRLIIQGKDRYAVYSTIVDNIIFYDATLEGLIKVLTEDAAEDIERDTRAWCAGEQPGRKHYTVDEAVEWVRGQHGKREAEEICAMLTAPLEPETPLERAVREFPVGTKVKLEGGHPGWNLPGDKVVCGHAGFHPLVCVCLVSPTGARAGWFAPEHLSVEPEPVEEEGE